MNIKVLISEKEIQNRIKEIAKQIEKDYENEEIVLICTLKGAVFFTTELAKNISLCYYTRRHHRYWKNIKFSKELFAKKIP